MAVYWVATGVSSALTAFIQQFSNQKLIAYKPGLRLVFCTALFACAIAVHDDPRHYFDGTDIQTSHPDWMGWIPDDTPLADLSMPVTRFQIQDE